MRAAPLRLLNAVLWPVTIWTSLTHLDEHPADDYVERTSPIVASSIAFWLCAAAAIAVQLWSSGVLVLGGEDDELIRRTRNTEIVGVFWFFLPVIYLVGFWLYTLRDEAFPR
jgi:hypothetical protein